MIVLVKKSVIQRFNPSQTILSLMETFRQMVSDCIRIGLEYEEKNHSTPSMKKLSLLCYHELARYGGLSQYRLTAISKATGILTARKKSIMHGFPTKSPYLSRGLLVSCYGIKIKNDRLIVPLAPHVHEPILLNSRTLRALSDPTIATIVVEHRDRLARFGAEYIEAALAPSHKKILVINQSELKDDLVQDMIDVLVSFCARLHGRRAAKNRVAKAKEALL